ncbi:hypothetical protein NQ318_013985 [Aromia moschata]|uniref:Uncharacterized protein n=1 Tax=Aromia moschata TaxID=1265417 RepID=A0AAV8YZV2_9CUCU|nr:hypothetical protein NQ318_013985 [Aromia moschata]
MVIERGSWYPNQKPLNKNKNHRAILKNRFKDFKEPNAHSSKKPEWLKEWTISKGWVHNKSHLLELGKDNSTEDLVIIEETRAVMEAKNYDKLSETSSVQEENIDDLISVDSHVERSQSSRNSQLDFDRIETMSSSDEGSDIQVQETNVSQQHKTQNMSLIFNQVSDNYRQHFPENFNKYNGNDLSLPEVYKERLLTNKNKESNMWLELWRFIKPKRRKRNSYNCKFTVNQLYDSSDNMQFRSTPENPVDTLKSNKRNSLGRNIALYNTLNSRTNLHEETIYECSDENSNCNSLNNVYFNPVYAPTFPVKKYYDFHSNHRRTCNNFAFNRKLVTSKNRLCRRSKDDSLRTKLKTEKYVIRHIRVRIMLSLRVGRVQKVYRNTPGSNPSRTLLSARNYQVEGRQLMQSEGEVHQMRISSIHEEQRRIGNGKTSIKIQNMR